VYADQRRIFVRHRIHGDLELARQIGKFRIEGRPLADQLAPRTRVRDFLRIDAGKLIGGGVTNAVTAGLDTVHLDAGQRGENIRHVLQVRPVELDVLAGGHVAVALVPGAADVRQHAQLLAVEHAVGHSDTQHRRVALDIEAVLQAQRTKLFFAQFAVQITPGLVTELGDALVKQTLVIILINVHRGSG